MPNTPTPPQNPREKPRQLIDWGSSVVRSDIQSKAERGLTLEQIADSLGVTRQTLWDNRQKYPDLDNALKKGRGKGIEQVANALFEKAVMGDVPSAIFYLKARAGWSDRISEKELTDSQAQTSKLYNLIKEILNVPGDSGELMQTKELIISTLDTILLENGKPTEGIRKIFEVRSPEGEQ